MTDQTISVALANKRIGNIKARIATYPEHPQMDKMLKELKRYEGVLAAHGEDTPAPDKLLSRVERLVHAVRKARKQLETADDAMKAVLEERIKEYQTSLKNIQEHGKEKVSSRPVGVKLDIPADVLNAGVK